MAKKVFILEEHLDDDYEMDFLAEGYTHLRAFHACRPMKLSDYVHNGILPISYESALQDVRNRVVCDYVFEEDVILKFKKEWAGFEDIHKRVWLQMNKDFLLDTTSHYLIYGSEFINALAMQLGCRDKLKQIGIPTIFFCDIPVEDIVPMTLRDIQNVFNSGDTYDISFAVDKVLPQDIVDYEHPTKRLVDPYGGTYKPDYEKLKIYL